MTIVITGANRGIGLSLLEDYARAGRSVIGTARADHPDVAGADWHRLEVTDPADQKRFAKSLDARPVDLLICNAGVYADKGVALQQMTTGMWAQSMAVNVTGVFLTIQALLPNLRAADAPKIAIISSRMASQTHAPGGSYAYRASKAAVLNLGRNLSRDLAADGIAVGIYHPGWVQTDMGGGHADIATDEAVEGLRARFDILSMASTGIFEDYAGEQLDF